VMPQSYQHFSVIHESPCCELRHLYRSGRHIYVGKRADILYGVADATVPGVRVVQEPA
jgi:hypothetical protein